MAAGRGASRYLHALAPEFHHSSPSLYLLEEPDLTLPVIPKSGVRSRDLSVMMKFD
jgi:hypothetical protein